MSILTGIKNRWAEKAGYKEVLNLAFPLILSTGSWSIQHFVDRMFLTWYSADAIAASVPAGVLNFTFISLFIGTGNYVSTFVAQYFGAKREDRIGPAVWQGLYFAIGAGLLMQALYPFTKFIFMAAAHAPSIQALEISYFNILLSGSVPTIVAAVCSAFFMGQGKTWPVMWVNFSSIGINLILDYFMIFGHWIFPEWGMAGAAIATVIAAWINMLVFIILLFLKDNDERFGIRRNWQFEFDLFKRLLRFGFPNGVQFMLEMMGFSFFIILVGRLGTESLAATNIAFNLNALIFLPMVGFGMATSIMVGQYLGMNQPELAEKYTWSTFHMTFLYMSLGALFYIFFPDVLIAPYASGADPESFQSIYNITVKLLYFIAFYSLFDTMNLVFSGAIKGAGDTRFVMILMVVLSWTLMVIPTYVACVVLGKNVFWGWSFATLFVVTLGTSFYFRFRQGKWKSMRVIEESPCLPGTALPDVPCIEVEL